MQYKKKAQLDVEYGCYQVFGIARKIFQFLETYQVVYDF